MPEVLITGGCGFIGSHLADALLGQGFKVRVLDNLSNGSLENLKVCDHGDELTVINGNLTNTNLLDSAVKGCEAVFHLAAHANVQNSARDTSIDLENNTLATHNLLESMRKNGVGRLMFASSAAVYGESGLTVLDEDYGPLLPISLYGASKLAGEGLVSAYSHLYGLKATMFRFANVVGSRRRNGVIYDFVNRLKKDPAALSVLGDGSQSKPYLHVSDCVAGILLGFEKSTKTLGLYNLGTPDSVSVRDIACMVASEMGLKNVCYSYEGGERGWRGDAPQVRFDISRICSLGFKPRFSSLQAVKLAIKETLKEI
ncbi:UDP-glucose 4-epimerase [Dehalococcoides mccartyi]|jgi:UDP-glucose 4-epimerase|uniref:UDP-glucose 4-epimerase n=1 Tax=Dehalococcoides mccartyi TaxID=61435 RepID=A0A328EMR1_9CHLR|nr:MULTISPECIES: NAD-dependent epimerase/dehydratase family protein [Dehalococcoides]AGG05838.1 NAD-dependent epimerase/dehydratase [Dehalococcoides mccartyi DCMB5]PKH47530.1 epimerase [Dehalococcoides mccartyi]RAL69316.1 UDP-glucose 4-epimerase [Dehalococcoides mccartyi]RAL70638.1 UDP-glucose 4-epimerase [Dehalococcoides mccartyi]BAS31322.1 NAD-dependent epimerase/ dehydratase [Dehalococcoides mccartyi IBARAKI]